jgi:hypothetical protein
MADLKISQLTGATTPLAGTEVLPIVQSGGTKKVSVADLTAGRPVAMAGGSFTDNIVQSTAGKGFDFTANTPAAGMTSELLNWYEEGTWTPSIDGETTSPTITYTLQYGIYTRIGRMVNFGCRITVSSISGGSGNVLIKGLPFTVGLSNSPYACTVEMSFVTLGTGYTSVSYRPLSGTTQGRLNQIGSAVVSSPTTIAQLASNSVIWLSGTYMVS